MNSLTLLSEPSAFFLFQTENGIPRSFIAFTSFARCIPLGCPRALSKSSKASLSRISSTTFCKSLSVILSNNEVYLL